MLENSFYNVQKIDFKSYLLQRNNNFWKVFIYYVNGNWIMKLIELKLHWKLEIICVYIHTIRLKYNFWIIFIYYVNGNWIMKLIEFKLHWKYSVKI